MTIKVARSFVSRLAANRRWAVIQVEKASDIDIAVAGLQRVGEELRQFDPQWVGPVRRAPEGPYLVVDLKWASDQSLRSVSELVVNALAEAGLVDARVSSPPSGGPLSNYYGLMRLGTAVVLRAYAPPPLAADEHAELPEHWIDEATSWVSDGLEGDHQLWGRVEGLLEFSVAVGDLPGFLKRQRGAREDALALAGKPRLPGAPRGVPPKHWTGDEIAADYAGRLGDRLRAVSLKHGWGGFIPSLVVAGGGPAMKDDDLLSIFDSFKSMADRLAPSAGYALVGIEPTFDSFLVAGHPTDWSVFGGERVEQQLERICDEFVFDAFPYQVLGPGHVRRLGGIPAGARKLGNGRVGLNIGDPRSWLIDQSVFADRSTAPLGVSAARKDREVQEPGRELLAPCLVRTGESEKLVKERWALTAPRVDQRGR